ncbi:IS3 family transposase [Niallia alba]|nr:IS3 family transposase [Niallia alba]
MKSKKKFTVEDKILAVQLYLSGKFSYQEVAGFVGIDRKSVMKWVRLYQKHGKEALEPRSSCTFYEPSFKLDVLKYRVETGASYFNTAIHFNLSSPYTVQRWEEQYQKASGEAFVSQKEGKTTMAKKEQTDKEKMEQLQAELEHLRMENAYLKKLKSLSSKQGKITKQDKVQVIYELRHEFPVVKLVKLAGIPHSTYYYMIKQRNLPDSDASLKEEITSIFNEHKGRYGYRRIRDELQNRGKKINHKKVQRIMNLLGLKSVIRMKKYKSFKGSVGKVAPNLLNREFTADQPNKKWVTDITQFQLFGEKLYLSPILDLFNGEIITYTLSSRPTYSLVSEMLERAFQRLPKEHSGLMMHSDQGWHYQMKQYQNSLTNRGIIQSMSRKGNCHDNAVIESFFGTLKSEFLYLEKFENVEQFKKELAKYIHYYNNKRIKNKLNGLSPVQYRTQTMAS